MNAPSRLPGTRGTGLVDVVDGLLHKGVVINGDATVSLAGVDLVYLRLSLLLSSVQRLSEGGAQGMGWGRPAPLENDARSRPDTAGERRAVGLEEPDYLGAAEQMASQGLAVDESPGTPDQARDLGRLVLTLVELLRRVLERQALRRMDGDGLPEQDIERMGLALMELDSRMTGLCDAFGLRRDELDIDLGPLGMINT